MDNRSKTIYKRCYFIACAVILLDLILKFNMMEFKDSNGWSSVLYAIYEMHTTPIEFIQDFFKCDLQYIKWWIFFWVEAVLLTFLFCFNLFSHAKQGVLLGVPKWDGKKFPWKRYLLLSVIPALVVSVCMCLRWITKYNSPDMNNAGLAMIYTYIVLSIFIVPFFILIISFVIAYFIARKAKKAVEAES